MRQDERAPFIAALDNARAAGYPAGEYAGQESFMRAGEIRELARRAGIGPGKSVLDLCCGVAGPGRLIAREFGCRYLGVDYSASALEIAGELAGELPCRFEQQHVPPLPPGTFDVILLLETMLAFPDKRTLCAAVADGLVPGGRFAFTLEEGRPLSSAERAAMPDADTVWLAELPDVLTLLADAGLEVTWRADCSPAHQETAARLLRSFRAAAAEIEPQLGERALTELIAAHQLWSDWLKTGRVRKFALLAEKR